MPRRKNTFPDYREGVFLFSKMASVFIVTEKETCYNQCKQTMERQRKAMQIERCIKPPFTVIGKEGSTDDGPGFIQKLWQDANAHFSQVQYLAQTDASGNPVGIWGVMSDMSRSYLPWEENFTKGLYLAGVECPQEAIPPEGWSKWQVPGYEYLCITCCGSDTFAQGLAYLAEHHLSLAGAVHDFTCPLTGTNKMFFPIRRL